jgi:hypothetical protein
VSQPLLLAHVTDRRCALLPQNSKVLFQKDYTFGRPYKFVQNSTMDGYLRRSVVSGASQGSGGVRGCLIIRTSAPDTAFGIDSPEHARASGATSFALSRPETDLLLHRNRKERFADSLAGASFLPMGEAGCFHGCCCGTARVAFRGGTPFHVHADAFRMARSKAA